MANIKVYITFFILCNKNSIFVSNSKGSQDIMMISKYLFDIFKSIPLVNIFVCFITVWINTLHFDRR